MLGGVGQQPISGTDCSTVQSKLLVADLKACSKTRDLQRGKHIHGEAVAYGHDSNIFVANALINMYAKCGSMPSARRVFDKLENRDVVSWNTLILGYAENGQELTALDLFRGMNVRNEAPANSVTFLAVLKACVSLAVKGETRECRQRGKEIHDLAMETGIGSNLKVQSILMDMYAKCGSMVDAHQVFNVLRYPDVVSWNTLILGYVENGQAYTALVLLKKMGNEGPAPDSVTFLAALKACASLAVAEGPQVWTECRQLGREFHALAVENGCDSDIKVPNTLIDMYAKCGSMVDARQVFDRMINPDVVSWNSLILGYADNGKGLVALDLFVKMRSAGPAPDYVTFLAMLKACGLVGGLEFGRRLHSEIARSDTTLDVVLVTCLVDFYARCGSLVEAQSVFDLHAGSRDRFTWTALLAGFSNSGDHESAFGLFERMQEACVLPDSVTFLSILTCCSHAGLVHKGKECFDAMSTKYGIKPTVEHYTCMVDILGRANNLDDAMRLLRGMSCSPDNVTWTTVLSAARKWKNLEIGRLAFQCLISLSDGDAAAYALMGQIYGNRGMLQRTTLSMYSLQTRQGRGVVPCGL